MLNFKKVFHNKHVILPVIHVNSTTSALVNASLAYEAGCDGVFLINMQNPKTLERMSYQELKKVQRVVREKFSSWWVGVNYLDLPTSAFFGHVDENVSGVWADNGEIDEHLTKQSKAEEIKQHKEQCGWMGLYFGGVAFKYQTEVDDPALAAKIATEYMDVVTTSGTMTGSAPDMEKIVKMKKAIGDFPLAIASGVSVENVKNFLPVSDCFLVATSLLKPGTDDFDPGKVRDLVDMVRRG